MSRGRVALAAALLFAPACTSTDEEQLYLPTEAEAQASADATISEENAQEEFDKLKDEIEAERR